MIFNKLIIFLNNYVTTSKDLYFKMEGAFFFLGQVRYLLILWIIIIEKLDQSLLVVSFFNHVFSFEEQCVNTIRL